MEAFEISDLLAEQRDSDRPYLQFLSHPALRMGVYVLPAGGVDRQTPHAEDEVYYVISGRGVINVAGEDRAVQSGSTIYVAAGVEHFFHIITEELVTLVFFAPGNGATGRQ